MIIDAESVERVRRGRPLRQFCRDYGLPTSDAAHLSRLVAGKPVAIETQRRIGRALGIVPPPRRVLRRAMTEAQAARWDRMTRAERNAALGA